MQLAVRCLAVTALSGAATLAEEHRPRRLDAPRAPHALPHATSRRSHRSTGAMDPEETQREVEEMVERVKELHDEDITAEFARELEGVEEALAVEVRNQTELSAEIRASRADLCTQQGFETQEMKNCEVFMTASCPPAAPTPLVPLNLCEAFFATGAVKLHALRGAAAAPGAAPGPAPGPGPALFGGKKLTELPEQGFHGKLIRHKDFETMAEDWMTEREGMHPREICRQHPDNEWCLLHFSGATQGAPSTYEAMGARQGDEAAAADEYQSASSSEGGSDGGSEGGSDGGSNGGSDGGSDSGSDGGAAGADGTDDGQTATARRHRGKGPKGKEPPADADVPGFQVLKDIFKPFQSSSSRAHALGALAAFLFSQLLH